MTREGPQTPLRTKAFRMFWMFLRLSVLFFLILWISKLPGDVSVAAFGYSLKMTVPFAIAALFLLLAVVYFIFGVLRSLLGFGQYMRFRRYRKHRQKADQNFKEGLCAFFADDLERAFLSFKTASKYDTEQRSVYQTFMALSALNSHHHDDASVIFKELTESTDLKFLGYFGLYQLESGSKISLLEQAFKNLPTQKWVLEKLFAAYQEALSKDTISKAEGLVGRLYDLRHITKKRRGEMYADVNIMRMKLATQENDLDTVKLYAERAYDFDHDYAPGVIAYAPHVDTQKALKMLLRAFSREPSAVLSEAIQKILPMDVVTFHAFEEKLEPSKDPQSLFLLAILAYQAKLWGRARQLLLSLPEAFHDSRYHMLLQQIEKAEK